MSSRAPAAAGTRSSTTFGRLSAPRDWRPFAAPPLVALVILVAGLVLCHQAGVTFRDPDSVTAKYLVLVGAAVAVLVGLDIAIRAGVRTHTRRPTLEAMRQVRAERWTAARGIGAVGGLLSFYLSYLAYRNLKAIVPLLRPDDLYDRQLGRLDRALLGGHEPATVLHDVIGNVVTTQVLSTFYAAFIVFLPLSLAIALVFAPRLRTTLLFVTALSINWGLGALSYLLVPSLGPVYADPGLFAALPHSEVTRLQQVLLDQRVAYLRAPDVAIPQAIAAFASLHIAMSFSAAAAAQLLRLHRRLRVGLWIWLAITFLATIYFGWHYLADDAAGVLIGGASLVLAGILTGHPLRARRDAGTAVAT